MIAAKCVQCGKDFQAQRSTAQYCTSRCRVAATRERQRLGVVAALPARRDGAARAALPAADADGYSLVEVTLEKLNSVDRLRTPAGIVAVKLAQIVDSGVQDTGSSIAALNRQYLATMDQALDGVQAGVNPLRQARGERELRLVP